jgi:DHA1 family tetracycline resistance protein-like MFS transporter
LRAPWLEVLRVPAHPPRKAAMRFIFVTVLLDVLGFGLLIPVTPKLVQALAPHAPDVAGATESDAAPIYGALIATYAAMMFLFAPVLGALSDRFGRRPVLLVSLLGSALDYVAMALAPTLWVLFLTRAINGVSGASISVCNAYIADVTPPEKRAGAYGLIGAAFGLGFIIGPLAGGLLGDIDLRLPFFVAAGLTAANWLYGYFVLPESLPRERRSRVTLSRLNPVRVFEGLGRYPLVLGMAGALFFMNSAMYGLHATWALYTALRYGWSKTAVGLSLAIVGLGAAIVQGGLARRIIPALGPGPVGERRAVVMGGAIAVLAYAGYASATEGWMIYAIIAVASLGGVAQPALQALITRSVRPDEQGAVQGSLTALGNVAMVIGPLLATKVFAAFTAEGAAYQVPGASFYLGSLLALIGLSVAARVLARHTPSAASTSLGDGAGPAATPAAPPTRAPE